MTVTVYTRHNKRTCPHKENRAWKKCNCPKWLYWHVDGKETRQTAGTRKWDVAAKQARAIEQKHEAALTGQPVAPDAVTLEGAIRLYLVDRESQHLAKATLYKARQTFERDMLPWFNDLSIRFLREVDVPQLVAWRGSWEDAPLAAKKKQERVRNFFWWCVNNKWLEANPAMGLTRIKVPPKSVEVLSDAEFAKIVEATNRFGKIKWQRERIRALVMLMRWSGLAIRDAVCLERSALTDDGKLYLRRAKTGVSVHVPLPAEVVKMLRSLPPGPRPNPKYFFWSGNGDPKSATGGWQRALSSLFELAALKNPDGTPRRVHPHLFRHTYATHMLSKGVSLQDVATLLGHSSIKTTERVYSHWIKARADALEASVRQALALSAIGTKKVHRASA